MRIIWLTPEFPSSSSNSKGIYIFRTVKELSKHYDLYVICLYPASPPIVEMIKYWRDWKRIFNEWRENYPKNSSAPDGIDRNKIIYLRYSRLPRGKFHDIEGWFAYLFLRKKLKKLITKNTIIHANWIFPAGTLAKLISNKFKIPYLISLMGSDINRLEEGSRFWRSAKKLLENAPMVTSVTEGLFHSASSKNILLKEDHKLQIDNFYEQDIFNIKSKVDLFKKYEIDPKDSIIFFAGGLIPVKNVDILIDAFKALVKQKSNIKLYLAGAGSEEGKLKRKVWDYNLNERVVFLGPLISEKLIDYYNIANVFCLPSKSEGLPNVIVESLFCGTPVVASDVGGISTIVSNGINGFLVKPNSVVKLSEGIKKSLDKKWNRQNIRESISQLSSENILKKYNNLYNSIGDQFFNE